MSTGPQPPDQPSERPDGPPAGQPGPGRPGGQAGEPQVPQGQQPPPPPPPGYQGGPAPARPMRTEDEKLWAVGAHLGPLVLGFIAPLVVWLVFKDRSAFLDRHGKEALNFQIAYLVYFIAAGLSLLVLVGFVLLPALGIAWVALMIVAAVKASQYEDYRYPAIFRVIS